MVENIRSICKEKGIAVSRLERDLGYGNGFLNPKKIQAISAWRAVEISEYLGVTMDELMGKETKKAPAKAEANDEVIIRFIRSLPRERLRGILLALGAPEEVLAALDQQAPTE